MVCYSLFWDHMILGIYLPFDNTVSPCYHNSAARQMMALKYERKTMEYDHKNESGDNVVRELYEALLMIKTPEEMDRFLKDLCTPQEIKDIAERWRVCRILDQDQLSYREINALTGASLATIGRVARFLKTEPHQGYRLVLKRMQKKK